jgi:hypothetical protein
MRARASGDRSEQHPSSSTDLRRARHSIVRCRVPGATQDRLGLAFGGSFGFGSRPTHPQSPMASGSRDARRSGRRTVSRRHTVTSSFRMGRWRTRLWLMRVRRSSSNFITEHDQVAHLGGKRAARFTRYRLRGLSAPTARHTVRTAAHRRVTMTAVERAEALEAFGYTPRPGRGCGARRRTQWGTLSRGNG